MKKITTIIALLLILSFTPISVSEIEIVKAQGTIYIHSDGSIEGTDFIQRNNNTYTFLNDISGNIVILKDFITIDGSGFTLKGSGDSSQTGINLAHRKNVTITNLIIIDYFTGISCRPATDTSTKITIWGNYIRNCGIGIELLGSYNNLIKYNTFKNNSIDIGLNYVLGNNLITQNSIESFVQVWVSDQPTIDMNYWTAYNGTDSDGDGIGDSAYYYYDILQDSHPLIDPVPVIPQFPSWIILPLLMMAPLIVIIFKKKVFRLIQD